MFHRFCCMRHMIVLSRNLPVTKRLPILLNLITDEMIVQNFKSQLAVDEAETDSSEHKILTVAAEHKEKNSVNSDEECPVQCEFCGKKYKNDKRLKDHNRFCHPKIYHKCNICHQQFPKKWILNTHMRKHTGEYPYSCSYCRKKFISKSKLQTHLNAHHKVKDLLCKICNAFGFYTKQDLGNHIRVKHTKERVFHCDVCNKSFMSSNVFYQHRLIHTGVRNYSCTMCPKAFKRWLTLQNHLKIHNNERPFSCDVCGQAFRQKGDMRKHRTNQHSNIKV